MINNLRELEELHQRFHQLRMEEYSKFKNSADTNAPTAGIYPLDFHHWCHSPFIGWAMNDEIFNVAGLSDYQRIIPITSHNSDYKNWDQYRLILSDYETDEDYAKYCDELSKKIKWIEEYLDDMEFSKLKDRGFKQAMKIAAEFSHLPYSLAVRGYEEHVLYVRPYANWKDLDNIYIQIWKQVTKQKMSFTQALEEIHTTNMFPSRSLLINLQIQGATCFLSEQFAMCMEHIPKNVEVDDEVLQHISYVIHKLVKVKTYVHNVRKKLKIGQRLQMTPNRKGTLHGPIEDQVQFSMGVLGRPAVL
ncbi:hypothetical protein GQ55_6G284800 [Panicum hallii var. hallii]|uniref:Uncharacterized protein n=1 Tax=Panicum hallii var. hallii TaxID=1504633 RepID=A0A2T7DAK0_9POAL|nr:hypothetical protein GQ55_6G284800 [Panicum hallii var. hallii]